MEPATVAFEMFLAPNERGKFREAEIFLQQHGFTAKQYEISYSTSKGCLSIIRHGTLPEDKNYHTIKSEFKRRFGLTTLNVVKKEHFDNLLDILTKHGFTMESWVTTSSGEPACVLSHVDGMERVNSLLAKALFDDLPRCLENVNENV